MQADADVHDTAASPWGATVVWLMHGRTRFFDQRPGVQKPRIRQPGEVPTVPRFESGCPMNAHMLLEKHDSATGSTFTACPDHARPFHRITNGLPSKLLSPAAMQATADEHDTVPSSPPKDPLPDGWTDHAEPFQVSTTEC